MKNEKNEKKFLEWMKNGDVTQISLKSDMLKLIELEGDLRKHSTLNEEQLENTINRKFIKIYNKHHSHKQLIMGVNGIEIIDLN